MHFFFCRRKVIQDLCQSPEPINQNNDVDAIRYIFITRAANYLASRNRTANVEGLFKKIVELEARIGYAETMPSFIQQQVLREKQLFYIFYSNDFVDYNK